MVACAVDAAAGIDHVREYHGGAEEDIIFTNNAGIDRYIVLHLHVVADFHSIGYKHILPKGTVLTDFCT